MYYKLPPLEQKLFLVTDAYVKLRYNWLTNYYRNYGFYAIHSGWNPQNPSQYISRVGLEQMYGKLISADSISSYVPLTIPRGTIVKIAKLAIGKNSGYKHVNISITKTHNKHTHWCLPTLYLAMPVEEFEELDLEKAV